MNKETMTVVLVAMTLATIGGLFYLAIAGNVWATGILFSMWTILCVIIGWLMSFIQQSKSATKEQESFVSNAKENLAIMAAMQSVQNKQNQTLMSQIGQAARLPQAALPVSSLTFENEIFEQLED